MLVGEKQQFVRARTAFCNRQQRPIHDFFGVATGANRAAVAPNKRFQVRRRVHIRNRNDALTCTRFQQTVPCFFDLVDVGHVGHRATGVQVGQNHFLVTC